MAIKNEKTQQSKKPLLTIGLILLFAALFVGVGFFLTGSIVFARNAIALLLLGGAGVGIATPVVKGINSLINKEKSNSKTQTRTKDRTQEENLEQIPEEEEEYEEEETMEVTPVSRSTNTQTKGRR